MFVVAVSILSACGDSSNNIQPEFKLDLSNLSLFDNLDLGFDKPTVIKLDENMTREKAIEMITKELYEVNLDLKPKGSVMTVDMRFTADEVIVTSKVEEKELDSQE